MIFLIFMLWHYAHVTFHASSAAVWLESPRVVIGVTWYDHDVIAYFNWL